MSMFIMAELEGQSINILLKSSSISTLNTESAEVKSFTLAPDKRAE